MADIAYILLCHKDPDAVIRQVRCLIAAGDQVALHFDRRAPAGDFAKLQAALAAEPNVVFAPRVRCGWGEWSLVRATLNGLEVALSAFPQATHFYLISGDCQPIKSAEHLHAELDRTDADIIESVDFFTSGWIRTGFVEERLVYRHFFNERTQSQAYYTSLAAQRALGLRRRLPRDVKIRIGSQWWCLRRATVEALMAFVRARPDIVRFFRGTWIPDEIFFQTLVHHLVPQKEIQSRSPTFLMFSDYGMPVTFYNDHFDFLLGQDYCFARKISPEAVDLKARLGALYAETGRTFPLSDEGRRLYAFLAEKGRTGARHAPRFWERHGTIGRGRELLLLISKKWHVARRLTDSLSFATNLVVIDYLFDQEDIPLPDLGGIEVGLAKRTRHRRALLRMLYDRLEADRMMICLDPAHFELVRDFYGDQSVVRALEIDCKMTDAYLVGHANRVGLLGATATQATVDRVLPAIRNSLAGEAEALRDARFPRYHRIRETADPEENARALADFLSLPIDQARQIADTPRLFAD